MNTISPFKLVLAKSKKIAVSAVPFLGARIHAMPYSEVSASVVPTMAVDKYGRGYVNPNWAISVEATEFAYGIVHEVAHDVLRHGERREGIFPTCTPKQAEIYNTACDLVVEQMLSGAEGATLKKLTDCVQYDNYRRHFAPRPFPRNSTVAQYCALLVKYAEEDKEQEEPPFTPVPTPIGGNDCDSDEDCGSDGFDVVDDDDDSDDSDDDGDSDGSEGDEESDSDDDSSSGGSGGQADDSLPASWPKHQNLNPAEAGSNCGGQQKDYEPEGTINDIGRKSSQLREVLTDLENSTEEVRHGSLAGAVLEELRAKFVKVIDPFARLKNAVGTATSRGNGPNQKTWRKAGRVQVPMDGRLMGKTKSQPSCVIIVDTSGSMECNRAKDEALSVVAKAVKRLKSVQIYCADTYLQSKKVIKSSKNFEWKGGGGTDMGAAAVEAYKDGHPRVIVVITDGETDWPVTKMRCKLIIALVGAKLRGQYKKAIPKWATVIDCVPNKTK